MAVIYPSLTSLFCGQLPTSNTSEPTPIALEDYDRIYTRIPLVDWWRKCKDRALWRKTIKKLLEVPSL